MSGALMTASKSLEIEEESAAVAARRREWIILLVLAAVQFTAIVDFVVMMPLGPQLMKSLEISYTRKK